MERPYFITTDHFDYLKEMTESKVFTKEEIKGHFKVTFPMTTFRVNKIFKYSETVLTF